MEVFSFFVRCFSFSESKQASVIFEKRTLIYPGLWLVSVVPKKWVGKLIMSLTPNRLKFFYQVFLDRKIILVRQCANKKLWWCVCVCFLGEGEGGCSPSSTNEDTTQRQDFSGKFKRIIFKMRQLLVYPQTAQNWKRKKIFLLLFPLSFFFCKCFKFCTLYNF